MVLFRIWGYFFSYNHQLWTLIAIQNKREKWHSRSPLYGYIQIYLTKFSIVGYLDSLKNFLMLAVSQWTFLLIIIVSIGEIPVSGIAGWCDMHVFNTFIIYYLFALKSCTGFIPLPAACKKPLFFYNYTCSEYFIFSLSQFGKKNVISWFYFAFVITSMNEQFYICFLPIELFFF